jgi:hypothetical protein
MGKRGQWECSKLVVACERLERWLSLWKNAKRVKCGNVYIVQWALPLEWRK